MFTTRATRQVRIAGVATVFWGTSRPLCGNGVEAVVNTETPTAACACWHRLCEVCLCVITGVRVFTSPQSSPRWVTVPVAGVCASGAPVVVGYGGLTPSRVCGRHPVGRAGGCLPGGYPQGLPTGANTPKRTPKAHHEAHTARVFSKRPETTNNPQATTNHNHNNATVDNWGVITPHARQRWPCARRNPRQGFRWQPRTHTVAAQRTPTRHTTPGLPQPATTLLHALKTPTLACAAAPLGVSKGGDFGT